MSYINTIYKKYSNAKKQLTLVVAEMMELQEVCGFGNAGDGMPTGSEKGDNAVVNYLSKLHDLETRAKVLSDDMNYYRNIIQVLREK